MWCGGITVSIESKVDWWRMIGEGEGGSKREGRNERERERGRRSKEVRERWRKAGRITNRYGYIIPIRKIKIKEGRQRKTITRGKRE